MAGRSRIFLITLLLTTITVGTVAAAGPDEELARARQYLQAGKYDEAIEALERALRGVDSLPADIRDQASTAINFYSAVAFSALERDDEAAAHLREVLRLNPDIRSVDPAKYDEHFIKLFNHARAEVDGMGEFRDLYPGFSTETVAASEDIAAWEGSPAMTFLATREEKREWRAVSGTEERERFMADFWKRRDPTPGTEKNEFRETFDKRVSFADLMFGTLGARGALSDRGKVFILLGEPAHARRRAIVPSDNLQVFNRGSVGIVDGTIEYWFYKREQLPVEFLRPTVTYRFVSHQGVGDNILQRDGTAINILSMTASASKKE